MVDENSKRIIFDLVRKRLKDRSESLELFFNHWKGTASGIEGWFKLEFVAAIGPHFPVVRAGGAGGKGRVGSKYPDLIIETPGGQQIKVEAKGGGNSWYIGGADIRGRYRGCIVAFLCRSLCPIKPSHQRQCKALDANVQIAQICELHGSKPACSLYFGMIDLT